MTFRMQQYQVPQFITIEDRIVGPLTLKQFLYLLGAAGVTLLGWFFLHLVLFAIITVPFAALFLAMAFLKVNGVPFPTVFANAINYYLKPRLYLWQHVRETPKAKATESPPEAQHRSGQPPKDTSAITPSLTPPGPSAGKLSNLAWALDVQQQVNRR